ncbi:hypothetical protein Patl1_36041 [Pistacia atlantica]|nr:hypothetical protein Patl1_36041 [Pistacia atlantica]
MAHVAEKHFPEDDAVSQISNILPSENVLVKMPGAIVHLIEREHWDEIQWPLAKDEPAVKLDESHYFFTLRVPEQDYHELLNYGLTIATKGQGNLLRKLDSVLETYCCFSVEKPRVIESWEVVAREMSPEELESEDNKLNWSNEFLRKRMKLGSKYEISPATVTRIKKVKKMTKMSKKATIGILFGVVKMTGFLTNSIANSKAGKEFFSFLPGEVFLSSLDGFEKVINAVEVTGKNCHVDYIRSNNRACFREHSIIIWEVDIELLKFVVPFSALMYEEEAAKATNEGLNAAGDVIGSAWTIFKIKKVVDPMTMLEPKILAKATGKAN